MFREMDLEKRLKGMLARVFSDGMLDDAERAELETMWKSGGLTNEQVRKVMSEFVKTTYKHVMADGTVTNLERAKLQNIVRELKLPDDAIPEEVRVVIDCKAPAG
jgi:uncharacterized membrane protein YebE (DUF533 family)